MSGSVRRGRSLKLYLVDGTPAGVITAELGVSTVKAVVASRTSLPELTKRDEARRTGVYLLLGPDPELSGRQLLYIGEGDEVRTRLASHDADKTKDFFTRALLIVSKDENLTKAHGRYLESRLIAAVRSAGRAKLVNGTQPDFVGLPEAEKADMERGMDDIEVLLPVMGFDVLQPAPSEPRAMTDATLTTFVAVIRKAKGHAVERNGEFVVLAGSTANRAESQSIPDSTKDKRAALLEAGILVEDANPDLYRFEQDASFGSPSGASAVIAGRSDNGRQTWRVEGSGASYDSWRTLRLEG